jgi:glycosyltransferase involved in cell wall biosynthesis
MLSHVDKTRVAFSVTNCICHDQRVLKIAESVSGLGCTITIIGRKSSDCCKKSNVPFRTKRFRMIFNNGFLFYKFFNIRLLFFLLFHKYDLLVANDLDTLLPNFIISKLKRLPLIYDSHEYFTGVPELQNRPFVRWIWKCIERTIFPHLKYVMTVSDSIAVQYESEYGVMPITVRNCSRKADHIVPFSREELGVNAEHLLLILQGTGINIDRGGTELIEAFCQTEKVSLLIIGSGDLLEALKNKVIRLNLTQRVKFFPKVPWEVLMRYTKSADAGISLDKGTNMNYRFSLPNKLFDYISAGIPVIASDLPEVKRIVLENECGLIIDNVTSEIISGALLKLKDNRAELEQLRKNAVTASVKLTWNIESEKVKVLYHKVLSGI